MSSYRSKDVVYGNDQLEGFVWESMSDKSKLTKILATATKRAQGDWNRIYDSVLPMYREWVSYSIVPVFVPFTMQGLSTAGKLSLKTYVSLGDVTTFLNTLHAGVMSGQFPSTMLNPLSPGVISENLFDRSLDKAKETTGDIAGMFGKILTPVIIGAVVIAVIVYSPQLKKAGGKISSIKQRVKTRLTAIKSAVQ